MLNETARIASNERLYGKLHLASFEAPLLSKSLEPGQFVHMRIPGMADSVLRRPFSVYSWDGEQGIIEILYQVVGKGSAHLASLAPGTHVDFLGPVGNGWKIIAPGDPPARALLVGGGVGAAPLFEWCRALLRSGSQVDVALGATTKDALVARDRYAHALGCEPCCSTDDGTYGHAGFATGLVEKLLRAKASSEGTAYDYIAVCGPSPLMRAVSDLAADQGIPCQVSLERRMACGIGACLSCVCDTVSQGRKRVCVDGPVFDAREVAW